MNSFRQAQKLVPLICEGDVCTIFIDIKLNVMKLNTMQPKSVPCYTYSSFDQIGHEKYMLSPAQMV